MVYRYLGLLVGLSAIGMFLILQLTTPSTTSPLGILTFFVLFYAFVLGVLTLFLFSSRRLYRKVFRRGVGNESLLTARKSYFFASVLAFAPVIIVAMRSVGELSILDLGLVAMFEAIACFYVWRRV